MVTAEMAANGAFRNRKGTISQNALGVVGFDMCFHYVLCGWEGSAHDGRVLKDAHRKGMPHVRGKYYLGDAAYGISPTCLPPYRGIRYQLKEWGRAGERPANF